MNNERVAADERGRRMIGASETEDKAECRVGEVGEKELRKDRAGRVTDDDCFSCFASVMSAFFPTTTSPPARPRPRSPSLRARPPDSSRPQRGSSMDRTWDEMRRARPEACLRSGNPSVAASAEASVPGRPQARFSITAQCRAQNSTRANANAHCARRASYAS